jgi:hypothetical protein
MLASLTEWVPRFVKTKLRALRFEAPSLDLAIADDAIQHLLIRVVQGRVTGLALTDDVLAIAWSKRVVLNYVRDEARLLRRRSALVSHGSTDAGTDAGFAIEHDLQHLIRSLRLEVVRGCRRNSAARTTLFDEFVRAFHESQTNGCDSATASKRRRRGRALARDAWSSLRKADPSYEEFARVADAFGL